MSFIETTIETPDESKEQQLQKARSVIAGSVPLIADPENQSLELQRGLYRNGDWMTDVTVRELTGADEEAMARVKDTLDLIDMILCLGTTHIGTYDMTTMTVAERSAILGELLVGERSQILLAIVICTYGNQKTIKTECQICGAEQEIDLILSEDFKMKPMTNPHQIVNSYVTGKNDKVEYRPVSGSDQMEALRKKGSSTAEQNTIILSRCITSRNGAMIVDPIAFCRSLSIKDRQALLKLLLENQPGIDLSLNTNCIGCGGDQQINLGWLDLFQ